MEEIRKREEYYYTNTPNYIEYLEFWANKSDLELDNDVLFNISKYLGKNCGLLSKTMRKYWLNLIGISVNYENLIYLDPPLKNSVIELHIDCIEDLEISDLLLLPRLNVVVFGEKNIERLRSESEKNPVILTKIENIARISRLEKIIFQSQFKYSKEFRRETKWHRWHQHKSVVKFDTVCFKSLDQSILERIFTVNYSEGVVFSYHDILVLEDFFKTRSLNYGTIIGDGYVRYEDLKNCKSDGVPRVENYYTTFSDLRSGFQKFYELKYCKNYNLSKTILHVLLVYSFTNLEYYSKILLPLYKKLGITLKLTIIGNTLHFYNSYIQSTYSKTISNKLDRKWYPEEGQTEREYHCLQADTDTVYYSNDYEIDELIQDKLSEYLVSASKSDDLELEIFDEAQFLKLSDITN